MILSFHPCIEADRNILCAGRLPDHQDRKAIAGADAVILPQGGPVDLYRMARRHCRHVFPNYDARFDYPGKRGQIKLFARHQVSFPASVGFDQVADFSRCRQAGRLGLNFPFVLKLDWGGQGDTVYLIRNEEDLAPALEKAAAFERTGLSGLLAQRFIDAGQRTLRVVQIGQRLISYWRLQTNPHQFGTSVNHGARIDEKADPRLQQAARKAVERFGRSCGLNLAGYDILFDHKDLMQDRIKPLFLEINFFFGRKGLGGSQRYYDILNEEIDLWLARRHLSRKAR